MNELLLIVRRSLRQHALSTVVTAFAIALASGLVMGVFAIQKKIKHLRAAMSALMRSWARAEVSFNSC